MFVRIENEPRDYAWGATTGISDALGTVPSGRPEAELWLGAHAGSPSAIAEPSHAGGAATLADLIAADPGLLGGVDGSVDPVTGDARLPFLLKILAAGGPLSLQAHPSSAVALERFVAENEAGVPLGAPHRNYKDPFHKPELIFALTPEFHALCGFRDIAATRALVDWIAAEARRAGSSADALASVSALQERLAVADTTDALRGAVSWLLGADDRASIDELVALVVSIGASDAAAASDYALEFSTVVSLGESYPGDPGVVMSLLLNRVVLSAGEVLYLPAGNIHAYLLGTGVELMAASDNVLRGGLTPKYIDVDELVDVLDFSPLPVPYLSAEPLGDGAEIFRPDVPDFALAVVEREGAVGDELSVDDIPTEPSIVPISGPAIVIVTDGALTVAGAHGSVELGRGESAFVSPDEASLAVTGAGRLFIATTN